MSYRLCSKVWIEIEGKKVFGDGPFDLLELVDRKGSIRQAAQEVEMSYHQAWEIINMVERNLGLTLIKRQTGGQAGGGSTLTENGKTLVCQYKSFREEANEKLEQLFQKHIKF